MLKETGSEYTNINTGKVSYTRIRHSDPVVKLAIITNVDEYNLTLFRIPPALLFKNSNVCLERILIWSSINKHSEDIVKTISIDTPTPPPPINKK